MDWTTEESGFDSRPEKVIFLFSTEARPALGPVQPPIQLVLGSVKQLEREADC
jgi:hypothetical protein